MRWLCYLLRYAWWLCYHELYMGWLCYPFFLLILFEKIVKMLENEFLVLIFLSQCAILNIDWHRFCPGITVLELFIQMKRRRL